MTTEKSSAFRGGPRKVNDKNHRPASRIRTSNEWTWFERLERASWVGAGVFMGSFRAGDMAWLPAWAQAVSVAALFVILTWSQERVHRFLGRFAFFSTQ